MEKSDRVSAVPPTALAGTGMDIGLRAGEPAAILGNAARIGLLGGLVAVFIVLTGMIQAFSTRDIISGIVSMSEILLLMAFFGTAYAAISRSGTRLVALTVSTGLIAGFISSLLIILLVALGQVIDLGNVFISATQDMYNLVTFKQGLVNGSMTQLGLGLAMGALAVVIRLLPSQLRRAVMIALIIVIGCGLLQDLIRVTLSDWDALTPILKFLYETNGLSIAGAVTLFVLVTAVDFFWSTRGEQVKAQIATYPPSVQIGLRWGAAILGIIILLLLPILLGLYISDVMDTVGLYLLMGLGLNIVVGFAGLLDLGYVAFFAIGAYTVGILTSPEHATGIIHNWWLAAPFAVVVAVFFGVALGIPVLRMRGDYLAIVTLGFGEIIRILAISDFLKPWEGGAQGIQGIPTPSIGPIQFVQQQLNLPILGRVQFAPTQMYYYLFLAGCLFVIFITSRVKKSRLGRAWMAIREDEDVAQAMGINLVTTKLMAFGMGAAFGGLAGAIFASKIQSVYPHSFQFIISVNILAVIIIGGMGSIPGVIVGALALVGLPELLREVGDYRYLFFGAALVLMMLIRPEGLLPEARRQMELEEKTSEDAEAAPVIQNPGAT